MKKLRPQKKSIGKISETIISPCSDDITTKLVFRYLKNVYPILRINLEGKFKRTINVNGKNYSVSKNKNEFVPKLINDLSNTFSISQKESKSILFNYFKIKDFN
jgi:hypothetical protein